MSFGIILTDTYDWEFGFGGFKVLFNEKSMSLFFFSCDENVARYRRFD